MSRDSTDKTIALMYHAVGVNSGTGVDSHYSVTLSAFNEHMQACVKWAGEVLGFHDWLRGRAGVIVTFDDGHESNHRLAWPALAAIGGRADFFVNPAQVGTEGFATWAALREMADAGMSIQSHGLDHSHYLTALSSERLREELRCSRLEIENRVGHPVTLLSPPGGRRPAGLLRIAHEVGYTHVLGSCPAVVRRGAVDTVGRFAVTARLDVPTLDSWLCSRSARFKMKARYMMLDGAKRMLGDRAYEWAREVALGRSKSAT